MQTRLITKERKRFEYSEDQINYLNKEFHVFETHRGCPHGCPFCFEPQISVRFPIPEIKSNKIKIIDMNFLSQPNLIKRIRELGSKTYDDKLVYYDLVCGIDFRKINQDIADELMKNRFGLFDKNSNWKKGLRFAWDWTLKDQYKVKDCVNFLLKAGYKKQYLEVFILSNWMINKAECELKLDVLKVWGLKACNCVWLKDLRNSKIIPEHWTEKEIFDFRAKCTLHNTLVNFKLYPDLKKAERILKRK